MRLLIIYIVFNAKAVLLCLMSSNRKYITGGPKIKLNCMRRLSFKLIN